MESSIAEFLLRQSACERLPTNRVSSEKESLQNSDENTISHASLRKLRVITCLALRGFHDLKIYFARQNFCMVDLGHTPPHWPGPPLFRDGVEICSVPSQRSLHQRTNLSPFTKGCREWDASM
jgi:hypothetical protein